MTLDPSTLVLLGTQLAAGAIAYGDLRRQVNDLAALVHDLNRAAIERGSSAPPPRKPRKSRATLPQDAPPPTA